MVAGKVKARAVMLVFRLADEMADYLESKLAVSMEKEMVEKKESVMAALLDDLMVVEMAVE
jgi:hypothetical protein